MSPAVRIAVFALAFMTAAFALLTVVPLVQSVIVLRAWLRVPCVVTAVQIVDRQQGSPYPGTPSKGACFAAIPTYRFSIDARSYSSTRFGFTDNAFAEPNDRDRVIAATRQFR